MTDKFMQTLAPKIHRSLTREAENRGITLQELLRAEIIPDWLRKWKNRERARNTRRDRQVSKTTR